jgi:ribosomal protein L32
MRAPPAARDAVPGGSPRRPGQACQGRDAEEVLCLQALDLGSLLETLTMRSTTRCPYCGHVKRLHTKDRGCVAVCGVTKTRASGMTITEMCICARYPDRAGRWRR